MKPLHLVMFAVLVLAAFLSVGLFASSVQAQRTTSAPVRHMHGMQLSRAASMSGSQQPPPVARYDLQLGLSLTQDFSGLAYNVTALAQTDVDGYGPGYLLNGLTDTGYWYQVGVSYNWPFAVGGYAQGFGLNYEVFAPNQTSVYPEGGSGGGLNSFSGPVNSGDTILLSLQFRGPFVIMFAGDWNTGSYAIQGFDAENASYFQGTPYAPSDNNGFFTGLMTEWYHADPSYRDSSKVTYTSSLGVSSAWMWMDQFDQLNPLWNGTWISTTPGPSDYTENPTQLQTFSYLGATESSNAYKFVTGTIVPLSTSISLFAADQSTALATSNKFQISYVLNGQQQTAYAQNGTLTVNADNGTQVTISGASTASTASEKWVLNAQATDVSVSSGTNATFYYYDLVSQQTSFVGANGANPPNATLTYYTAPDSASGKTAFRRVDLPLGPSIYQTILPAKGTTVSLENPVPSSPSEQWSAQDSTVWTVQAPNQITARVIYNHQFLLSFSGAQLTWQWVNSGTTSQTTIPAVTTRSAGTGLRVDSYSIDGNPSTKVQPTAQSFTLSIFMNGPHQVTVNYVKQFQLSFDFSVGNVAYVTPPTISGDNYWYDQGTPVSLVLNSIIMRETDTSTRVQSYTLNGVQSEVSATSPVSVVNSNAISSPQVVTQTIVKQFKLTIMNGSMEGLTSPTLIGDTGWYDAGTQVSATFDYSWNQTTIQSRINAITYTTEQNGTAVLPRRANGTFDVAFALGEPESIRINSVTQYEFSVEGGFDTEISQSSPTRDNFFDAGTSLSVSSDYVNQTDGSARQSLTGYTIGTSTTNVTRAEANRFSTPQILLDSAKNVAFNVINQYFVNFDFTDSSGNHKITPAAFQIQVDSADTVDLPTFATWLDAGTSFHVSSVMWQGVEVQPEHSVTYMVNSPLNETVVTRVYDTKIVVIDAFGKPIPGAQVTCTMPNGTAVQATTNQQGIVALQQVPVGKIDATASNLGMTSSANFDNSGYSSTAITIFASYSTIIVLTAVLLVVLLIILLVALEIRRNRSKN